jgi:hypothetical protein
VEAVFMVEGDGGDVVGSFDSFIVGIGPYFAELQRLTHHAAEVREGRQ